LITTNVICGFESTVAAIPALERPELVQSSLRDWEIVSHFSPGLEKAGLRSIVAPRLEIYRVSFPGLGKAGLGSIVAAATEE
jgi:hypothetical protein